MAEDMTATNIPLSRAVLLATIFETLLYGISLPMFVGTIWVLLTRRATNQINPKVLMVACLLLVCSTAHLVICVIRIMKGLIYLPNTVPGSSTVYFSDASQWTFVSMNYVYHIQTLIGDGVILYRCYVVWQSKLIMVLPVLFWCAVAVTGIITPYTELQARQNGIFNGSVSRWITSFWASSLVTNVFTTFLLAYRIWRTDRNATSSLGPQRSELRPILRIVLDAGLIYSFTLITALVCFINRSNSQYVVLNMITPIISITFYMVIIRVALASHAKKPTNVHGLAFSTTNNSINVDRGSRVPVIAILVENTIHSDTNFLTSPTRSVTTGETYGYQEQSSEHDGMAIVV